jgi:hypothetical protein
MAERNNNRNKKREAPGCEDVGIPPTQKQAPQRKPNACDPEIEPAVADKFIAPEACPPRTKPKLVVPAPLVIGNDEVSSSCPSLPSNPGTNGDLVTITVNAYTDVFNFGSIDDINANQLTFLSGLSADQRLQLADPDTTVALIEAITHLSTAQATFLNEQVVLLKASVNAIAQAAAIGQLACFFLNAEQIVNCEDAGFAVDAYTDIDVPEGEEANVNNPSVVTSDVYTSPNSQEEADAIAASVALAGLKCYYGNDEVVVTCETIGFTEEVPTDSGEPISSDGRLRVGTVTIAADTVFSDVSRSTASAVATVIAQSQLVCFYINAEFILTCSDDGKEDTVEVIADVESGQSGSIVTVAAGFIQSNVSTDEANTRAEALATSLLECYWVNEEQCKECPTENVTDPDDPDGDPIEVTAQDAGPRCIAAGEVRSYISQEDADAQATILAEAQLICIYCNPIIYPKCTPESWSGIIPVPPEEIDSTWSLSATRGAAADTICSTSASDVVGVAVSIGNTVADISDASDCCYGNDAVTASCPNDEDDNPPDDELSSEDVIIAANTITVCDSDAIAAGWVGTTKAYATQLAQQLADAALVCMWSNAEQIIACPLPGGDDIVQGTDSVTIDAGLYISFRSQVEADTLAETVALAQLNCIYLNYGGENGTGGSCAPGTTFLGQPTITQGAVQSSVSSAAASTLADLMSDAAAVCAPNDLLGGEAGGDGAQTSCDGECYGYYS